MAAEDVGLAALAKAPQVGPLEAAQVRLVGTAGERTIPIDEFFQGAFSTALAPDELITEIRLPSGESRGWL